ncbi:MAG: hypothetical protein U1E01_22230, partial [Methylicorpusculum sp.]|nr:hypothetical protein [Methylicorpusculum sp.]
YLKPPQELVTQWCTLIQHDSNFKVGIMWKRNEQQVQNPAERMSIPFALFDPLTKIPGVSLYCLQQATEQETSSCTYRDLITLCGAGFPENNDGLLELAALMKNLDLVITLDCCAAHIAGAIGIPVWVILPTRADYRWIIDRQNFPWYPNMRLFKQTTCGDWNTTMNTVIKEVISLVKK